MKSTPLIINWHDQNAPVYSAHFEPNGKGRLATAGGDNNVRLWKIEGDGESRKVDYLSTLAKHTQAVNVVRWSPKGDLLASAGDDGNVILWVPSETHQAAFGSDGLEDKETWRARHMCRSSGAEIYDLAWSPDGSHFIIGSMDNIARIYNTASGYLVRQIAEHSHYVQGVSWDPLNEFIATQSSDRSVHIYSSEPKTGRQYQTQHQVDKDSKPTYEVINTVYIYTRGGINKAPIAHLPGHKKPSVVVRCSPIFYQLRQTPATTKHITIDTSSSEEPIPSLPEPLSAPSHGPPAMEPPPLPTPVPSDPTSNPAKPSGGDSGGATASTTGPRPAFVLPYRMVYAVATQDSVLLYDTQQQTPLCVVSNLHCATFTDLTWASDGLTLLITSSDGFCSTLSFDVGELGDVYSGEVPSFKNPTVSALASSGATQNPSALTPTSAFAPPSPYQGHQHRNSASSFTAPSPPTSTVSFPSGRPSSPARSNSVSSVTTQASTVVVSNPPLIVGSVPGIAATNSGKVTGIPITTPPETPRSSAATVGAKRAASEAEKDEPQEPKKRRVAPTPVAQNP
ncbi:unnamed protein product [Parascedosporium putredinis]|uniref:CAF1B/HIR1 beta-propeller domain-containing protein n=1 Tax=Parascedosporium putredinis TaxID=1442378 RepID=A0A9P1HB15_9PEZI|nr:unnamed protein product [Parascedosporium putredinis]CAI8003425.1 unnamed protein product [Parascedosporium putredinis]